jgi:hypothetical protein
MSITSEKKKVLIPQKQPGQVRNMLNFIFSRNILETEVNRRKVQGTTSKLQTTRGVPYSALDGVLNLSVETARLRPYS